MKRFGSLKWFGIVFLVGYGSVAMGYNCRDSCRDQAKFSTPFGSGVNPAKFAACKAWKTANCYDVGGDLTNPVCSTVGQIGQSAYPAAANEMISRHRNNHKRGLTAKEKAVLRTLYGDMVDRVQLIFGARPMDQIGRGRYRISMGTGAQTFGYRIYLKHSDRQASGNFVEQIKFVGHEMAHTQQYVKRGSSLSRFGRDYFKGWCNNNFSYSRNPLEREAHDWEKESEKRAEAYESGNGRKNAYSISCIWNGTDIELNYKVRWGDGNWKSMKVAPGKWRSHYWNYAYINENRSPTLNINFDANLTSADSYKSYRLKKFAVEHTNCNNINERETFKRVSGNRNRLDLYRNH